MQTPIDDVLVSNVLGLSCVRLLRRAPQHVRLRDPERGSASSATPSSKLEASKILANPLCILYGVQLSLRAPCITGLGTCRQEKIVDCSQSTAACQQPSAGKLGFQVASLRVLPSTSFMWHLP